MKKGSVCATTKGETDSYRHQLSLTTGFGQYIQAVQFFEPDHVQHVATDKLTKRGIK